MTVGVSLDAHLPPQWLIERVLFVRGGDTLLQLRDQTSAGIAVGHDGDAVAFQDDSRDKRGRWSTEALLSDPRRGIRAVFARRRAAGLRPEPISGRITRT